MPWRIKESYASFREGGDNFEKIVILSSEIEPILVIFDVMSRIIASRHLIS